jgi:hypothetical protein
MSLRIVAAFVFVAVGVSSGFAQQQPMQASPITTGFWSWPREKLAGAEAINAACQEKFAIQFADGRYVGIRLQNTEKKALPAPVVDEVGFCKFDAGAQTERCELRINQDDGTVKTGLIESTFRIEADQRIRMTVTEKLIDGKAVSAPSFDVFPTPCPEPVAWTALNGGQAPK